MTAHTGSEIREAVLRRVAAGSSVTGVLDLADAQEILHRRAGDDSGRQRKRCPMSPALRDGQIW